MSKTTLACVSLALSLTGLAGWPAFAEDAARPLGEPVLEPPTLHCLGAYWIIGGDDNQNAQVEVEVRQAGTEEWQKGRPLFRVEKGAHQPEGRPGPLNVPEGAWLFAGSVVLLKPDTEYELRLRLSDPDGVDGEEERHGVRSLQVETRPFPPGKAAAPFSTPPSRPG